MIGTLLGLLLAVPIMILTFCIILVTFLIVSVILLAVSVIILSPIWVPILVVILVLNKKNKAEATTPTSTEKDSN